MAKLQQRVFDWNGKDVPKTLRSLPDGRYVIEAIAPAGKLTASEDEGLRRALASVGAGRTISAPTVHAELRGLIKHGRTTRAKRSTSAR